MEDLHYIDDYFRGRLPQDETSRFDRRIREDAAFAEAVAFYVMAKNVAGEQQQQAQKEHFRELYRQYKPPVTGSRTSLVRRLLPVMAAAAVLAALFIGWYVWFRPVSTTQLADNYISKNLASLGVSMDNRQDSLQAGIQLYNEGKNTEALQRFEALLTANPADEMALRYAGITALRLEMYEKALQYFKQLEEYPNLYSNPGKFYHAITLMKRNAPGDREQAKVLLQQVAQNTGLEGSHQAQQWLDKW